MTRKEVIEALMYARPCECGERFANEAHEKAVEEAVALIKRVRNPYKMMMLSKRYLEGMSIKSISIDMGCGKTTVHRLLNESIEEIVNASKR